jgi:hypothetical protein
MSHRNVTLLVLLGFVVVSLAWAREDRLSNTGAQPAAEGKVVTGTDRNGNTDVEIAVRHLAEPQKLSPAKQGYLVWIQAHGKQPELQGVLRVNENLEGTLKTSTPYKVFDVLITAEDNLRPDSPSELVVLRGTVERK